MSTAELAAALEPAATEQLIMALQHSDSAVRYWAAMGLLMREEKGVTAGRGALRGVLSSDPSPSVRVAAAEALGRYGDANDLDLALSTLALLSRPDTDNYYVALLALGAIDALGSKANPLADHLASLPDENQWKSPRGEGYIQNLAARILSNLGHGDK